MATLNLRRLSEDVHAKLRMRAAKAGRSMEAEARMILAEAARETPPKPVDLEDLRVFILQLYGGELPTGAVDDLIAERRQAKRELEALSSSTARPFRVAVSRVATRGLDAVSSGHERDPA